MGNATNEKAKKHSGWTTVFRAFLLLVLLGSIFLFAYFLLKHFGLWEKVNSVEKLRAVVERGGVFSSLIFMFFQFLQTTFLQIPAIIVTMTGVLIFPKWKAFILSYIAIMLGSLFNFWLGRKAGRKFLSWVAGKDGAEKWIKLISEGKYVFFLMMLFPMFPDDILCVVAGLTNMSFSFFLWTNLLCRAVGIGGTVLFGSGAIIPFRGWGLAVWFCLAVVMALLFYFSVKYQSRIDAWLSGLNKRKKTIVLASESKRCKIENEPTNLIKSTGGVANKIESDGNDAIKRTAPKDETKNLDIRTKESVKSAHIVDNKNLKM